MSQTAILNETLVDYEELTEILLAHLEKDTVDTPYLIKNGVKVIL